MAKAEWKSFRDNQRLNAYAEYLKDKAARQDARKKLLKAGSKKK